jgi:beta-phosphoglucomutase
MIATPPTEALLFDLDGTLVDTWEANYRSYRDSLLEIGCSCPREEFASHMGGHWSEFLPRFTHSHDHDLLKRVHQRKQHLYSTHLDSLRVNGPLLALLMRAGDRWSTGLVTSASRETVQLILERFSLGKTFNAIVTGDDAVRPKPAPDGYLRCLELLGAHAEHSLAFEDSAPGIAAARAANIAVLVVHGFTTA